MYITDEIWNAVYEEATSDLRLTMDLAYLTGQRPADVRKMRWADVDGEYLFVGQGKTAMKLRIRLRRTDGSQTALGALLDQLDRSAPTLAATPEGKPISEKCYAFASSQQGRRQRRRPQRQAMLN